MAGMYLRAPSTAPATSGDPVKQLCLNQSDTAPATSSDSVMQLCLQRLNRLENDNAQIRKESAQLRIEIKELRNQNQYLGHQVMHVAQVQDQDAKHWARFAIGHVTAGILQAVKNEPIQPFRAHTHFQNALRDGNKSTDAITLIMTNLGIKDEVLQLKFCIDADRVVDERNRKAHHNSASDLRAAVVAAIDLFKRHPSLREDFEFNYFIISHFATFQATFPASFK